MNINIGSLLDAASSARGTAVIIDVYRAFTTAAIALHNGAEAIILVAEIEEALDLKNDGIGSVCMGEVGGMRPDGFDFGNSPYEISQADLAGKILIQSTRAGTVGVNAARNADRVYAASFLTAEATVESILRDDPDLVSIVAMGVAGIVRADEDEQCALYLRNRLEGRKPDHESVRSLVLSGGESQKFDDPALPHFHPKDKEYALLIDTIPFAVIVSEEEGLMVARRELYVEPI